LYCKDWGVQDDLLGAISGVSVEQTAQNLLVNINNVISEQTSVSVYSIAGHLIWKEEKNIRSGKENISLSGLKKGMYFIDVIRAGEPRFMQKFAVH
jgi:hypothetical protein